MLEVTVYVDSNGTHLHQIYTGLDLLHREGKISLSLRPGTPLTRNRGNRQFIAIKVKKNARSALAVFDMADHQKIGLPDALLSCDFYFKRSLTETSYDGLSSKEANKIKPFGFNYQVINRSKKLLLKRVALEYWSRPYNPFLKKNRFHLHNIKELLDANLGRERSPLLSTEEIKPKRVNKEFDVLFQCRLWDPAELDPRNQDDSRKVNEDRISIIRSLRSELGSSFVGGLQPTKFAKSIAPDLVIKDSFMSQRKNYLSMVERSALVISSPGLLGSNGWKLGEYVALGKAIVSEPIVTELPGRFEDGTHYESYRSPSECIKKVKHLLEHPEKIRALSDATRDYYWSYLSPKELMVYHLNAMLE